MKTRFTALGVALALAAVVAVANRASVRASNSRFGGDGDDDSNPQRPPEVLIPETYRTKSPTIVNGTNVYFTPQDENTSTTVLFVYNTTGSTATVAIQTFSTTGSTTISTSFDVPANGLVRICGDAVSTISASWSSPILINFTTFSAYAKMTLPAGVKVDGFVAWDTSGTYDPLESVRTVPIRFTPVFTDDPLSPAVTRVKAVHAAELRARIDAVREVYGLAAFPYTNPASAGDTVKAADVTDLRAALGEAYTAAGRVLPVYTDPVINSSTVIKVVHVAELRSALADIE